MAYDRQEFVDDVTVLTAAHLKHIEDGIIALSNAIDAIPKSVITTISLPANAWVGANGVFSQAVEMSGVTANSKVDLLPSPEQLHELLVAEISLTSANSEGAITVFAIGDAPTSDYTMQALITEVTVI